MKNINSIRFFSLILLFTFFEAILSLQIPIKLVKSNNKRRKEGNISIKNMMSGKIEDLDNYLFAVNVTVGANKQPFTLVLDTGSEIVWVPGIQTDNSNRYYNPQTSSTSKRTSDSLSYKYTDGSVSGQYYYDQINFMLPNNFFFNFGVANQINIKSQGFEGIIGLGRNYNIYNKKYSLIQTIKTNGGIPSTKFSFKYNYDNKDLIFYLGEIHEDFSKSNIGSCDLIESEFYQSKLWTCELYSFGVKNGNETLKKISIEYEGLFDSGTNYVIFPSVILKEFETIFTSFNCYINEDTKGNYFVHCRNGNNLPKITFGVKDYIFTLGKENFYTKIHVNNEDIYRLRLIFKDNTDICIIGQNFFFEFHTLFDGDNDVLKFYNENEGSIIEYSEKTRIKLWILITIIIGGVIILASITVLLIYCICYRKKMNVLLEKELLEMSSIQKLEDNNNIEDDNADIPFNHIMNIKTTKKSSFNKNKRNKK